ncbi:protein S100-B-like [Callorhinchus milii]|nr:protein S100-B-like [Callorhinchus milii]
MSELENALISIMKIFHKYSGSTTGKLKKAQVKELVNNELSRFIEKITDQETLDILMQDLDENGDLEIDFTEFATFVAMVTCTCHTFFTVQE